MYLSVNQVSEKLGVCASLVYGWCQTGQLRHVRVGAAGRRGCIRVEETDLEAFLESLKSPVRQRAESKKLAARKPIALKHLSLPN